MFGLGLALLSGGGWIIWNQFSGSSSSLQVVYENLDVTVEDLHLVQGGKGQRTWEVKASESRYIREESRLEFDQPRITFYKQEGSGPIRARAESGEYMQKKKVARLWTRVKATYGQTTVHSQSMLFDQHQQEITFEGQVRIHHPQAQATSQTAVIELQKNQLVLTGKVKVDIYEQNLR